MKIFTIYSSSHKVWYEIFRTSLFANCKDFELSSREVPQVCKTGKYGSEDIIKFWRLKVEYIIELLDKETEPFLYSDCDVYFFRDFKTDLEDRLKGKDILFQFEKKFLGYPMVCAGFMYMKPSIKMKRMFKWVYDNLDKYGYDQKAINRYLLKRRDGYLPGTFSLKRRVSYGILPKTYYSINYDNGNKIWAGEDVEITIQNPFMAHIHWAIGEKTRLKLLEKIKNHFQGDK